MQTRRECDEIAIKSLINHHYDFLTEHLEETLKHCRDEATYTRQEIAVELETLLREIG